MNETLLQTLILALKTGELTPDSSAAEIDRVFTPFQEKYTAETLGIALAAWQKIPAALATMPATDWITIRRLAQQLAQRTELSVEAAFRAVALWAKALDASKSVTPQSETDQAYASTQALTLKTAAITKCRNQSSFQDNVATEIEIEPVLFHRQLTDADYQPRKQVNWPVVVVFGLSVILLYFAVFPVSPFSWLDSPSYWLSGVEDLHTVTTLNDKLSAGSSTELKISHPAGVTANENPKITQHNNNITLEMGNELLRARKMQSAFVVFGQFLENQPLSAEARLGRAEAAIELRRFQEALEDLNQAVILFPSGSKGFQQAFYRRGVVRQQMGQMEAACLDFAVAAYHGHSEAKKAIQHSCKP